MSNLPVDPYNRTYIVEPPLDNPDRAVVQGSGKDFVVTLSDNTETPGSDMMFLSRSGKWVPFRSTDLVTWGSIAGDITEQADLMAMFAQYTPTTGYARVAFTGNYNDLLNKPPLGTVSPLDLDGSTSRFLRGDGTWQIPVDVNAAWGNISGNINAQTDLITLLNFKAPITNPTFQGLVNIPTPPVDDNSTLAINSAWFFGQAFNGTPQMDGVASSGNATMWARGNHRHPTDNTKIGDAPNDGQQYARQSQVWTVVAPSGIGEAPTDGQQYARKNAAWVPVAASGVWIGDTPPTDTTKYSLWWSSTTLQLAIWYDDGNSSQWVDTNSTPDSLQSLLLQDGTVAAPGLAFANEPGLGFYRKGASDVQWAAQGGITLDINAASSAISYLTLFPRAATGASQFTLQNSQAYGANGDQFYFKADVTGYTIAESVIGGGGSHPLTMSFPTQINLNTGSVAVNSLPAGNSQINLNKYAAANASDIYGMLNGKARWLMRLGNGNAGDDFFILRADDTGALVGSAPIGISRSSGLVSFGDPTAGVLISGTNGLNVPSGPISGTSLTATTGPVVAHQNVYANTNHQGLYWDGGVGYYVCMGAGIGSAWSWQWNASTGGLNWLGGSSQVFMGIDPSGNMTVNGGCAFTGTNDGTNSLTTAGRITCNRSDTAAFYAPNGGVQVGAAGWAVNATGGSILAAATVQGAALAATGGGVSINATAGHIQSAYNLYAQGGAIGLISGANPHIQFTSDNWRLEWQGGTGKLYYYNPSNQTLFWADGGNFNCSGKFYQPGGGVVGDNSDIRIKDNVEDYTAGLDAILGLRPRTYTFKPETGRDPTIVHHGLVAQEAMITMPEMVTLAQEDHQKMGEIEHDDMLSMQVNPMLYAMVNSIHTLHARIAALEAAR